MRKWRQKISKNTLSNWSNNNNTRGKLQGTDWTLLNKGARSASQLGLEQKEVWLRQESVLRLQWSCEKRDTKPFDDVLSHNPQVYRCNNNEFSTTTGSALHSCWSARARWKQSSLKQADLKVYSQHTGPLTGQTGSACSSRRQQEHHLEGVCGRRPSPTPPLNTRVLRAEQFIPCHRPGESGGRGSFAFLQNPTSS